MERFTTIYGGYYLINPSQRGEDILKDLNIPYPTIIAHRGASDIAPESTRPAYIIAKEIGVAYLEADIHRIKDGELVIFHDSTLKRTSNVNEVYPDRVNDHISTFNYEELNKLDYGNWFNKKYPNKAENKYKNLNIITLKELLKIANKGSHKTGVVLDIKDADKYQDIENDILKIINNEGFLLDKHGGKSNVIIFSFNLDILLKFKEKDPDIPRTLLLNNNSIGKRDWKRWLELAENYVNGLGVKGFVSWPWLTALAHERNLFVFPYVVDKAW